MLLTISTTRRPSAPLRVHECVFGLLALESDPKAPEPKAPAPGSVVADGADSIDGG